MDLDQQCSKCMKSAKDMPCVDLIKVQYPWGSNASKWTDIGIFQPSCQIIYIAVTQKLHCVSKKLPTFKLSVTLSNLNQFSKFLHHWKAYEICYKTHMTLLTSP